MSHMSMLLVDLTFGEVNDVRQRSPRSQLGLRPETKKVWTTEKTEGTEKRKRKAVAIASLWPQFSLWWNTVHMPKAYADTKQLIAKGIRQHQWHYLEKNSSSCDLVIQRKAKWYLRRKLLCVLWILCGKTFFCMPKAYPDNYATMAYT